MDKSTDNVVDFVTNPFGIDLLTDEVAVYTATGLSDDDLVDLNMVTSFLAANSSLTNDGVGAVLVFSVQGVNDTAVYSFTSENADGDADVSELSILAVVEDALLTGADYAYG